MYIVNTVTGDYWSNELGWCEDIALASVFSQSEQKAFTLPIDGKWTSVT